MTNGKIQEDRIKPGMLTAEKKTERQTDTGKQENRKTETGIQRERQLVRQTKNRQTDR